MKKQLAVISIIFVLVLIIIVNKIVVERTVEQLGKTSAEIYSDRLLAESYIYQLSDLFYKKKITLLSSEINSQYKIDKNAIQKQTSDITEVIRKYSLTKFTESEWVIFEKLKNNVMRMKVAEMKLFSRQAGDTGELIRYCEMSSDHLNLLSSIQVSEGNSLNKSSKKVLAFLHLFAELEWALYVIILILLVSNLRDRKILGNIFPKYQLN